MEKLSEHFTFEELTHTDHLGLLLENRRYGRIFIDQLREIADDNLEHIRAGFGKKLIVHSCFRCQALNKAVGGSASSQHTVNSSGIFTGAVDFHIDGISIADTLQYIWKKSGLKWHQLIDEGGWIHYGLPTGTKDGQVFRLNHVTKRRSWLQRSF